MFLSWRITWIYKDIRSSALGPEIWFKYVLISMWVTFENLDIECETWRTISWLSERFALSVATKIRVDREFPLITMKDNLFIQLKQLTENDSQCLTSVYRWICSESHRPSCEVKRSQLRRFDGFVSGDMGHNWFRTLLRQPDELQIRFKKKWCHVKWMPLHSERATFQVRGSDCPLEWTGSICVRLVVADVVWTWSPSHTFWLFVLRFFLVSWWVSGLKKSSKPAVSHVDSGRQVSTTTTTTKPTYNKPTQLNKPGSRNVCCALQFIVDWFFHWQTVL
jgi:hypothetical protein